MFHGWGSYKERSCKGVPGGNNIHQGLFMHPRVELSCASVVYRSSECLKGVKCVYIYIERCGDRNRGGNSVMTKT